MDGSSNDLAHEVIIVGGGPAGLSAALLLGRCRRRVVVCDAGKPRNRAPHALHGFLGHDGIEPGALLRLGREQLRQYSLPGSGAVYVFRRTDTGWAQDA
jgi:thioredoxin reductase